jgi:hypothetical protein
MTGAALALTAVAQVSAGYGQRRRIAISGL